MTMSTKEISEVLNKALEIELEGRKFYLECMAKTKHSGGQEMFRYLAQEEWIHYETVERSIEENSKRSIWNSKKRRRQKSLKAAYSQKWSQEGTWMQSPTP